MLQGHSNYGSQTKGAWLNTGYGWSYNSTYTPLALISGRDGQTPGGWNYGTRFVDLNADGLEDVVQGHYSFGGQTRAAWINTGYGWSYSSAYYLPALVTGRDSGAPAG